jgi:hypothetical protein
MKTILVFPAPSVLETPKSFFCKLSIGGLAKKRFL